MLKDRKSALQHSGRGRPDRASARIVANTPAAARVWRRHARRGARWYYWLRILALGVPLGVVGGYLAAHPQELVSLLAEPPQPVGGVTGRAAVVDGDTITVGDLLIRLDGIDAPESGQVCEAAGVAYDCGRAAERYLRGLVAFRTVTCSTGELDPYGRTLGFCTREGGDINRAMVAAGWALAYRHYTGRYAAAEEEAREQGLGLWQGRFDRPEDWRHARP